MEEYHLEKTNQFNAVLKNSSGTVIIALDNNVLVEKESFKQLLRQKLDEVEKEVWGKDELVRWEKVKELIGGMCK